MAMLLAVTMAACDDNAPSSARSDIAASSDSNVSPVKATRLGALGSEQMPAGFALADKVVPFEFPRDHGPHPDFRHEWWYVTGHLDAASGERFGFELTFFRFALAPATPANRTQDPSAPAALGKEGAASPPTSKESAWRTRQIYMAHFAVTDLDRGKFYAYQRYARDALGLAGARASPFEVRLDDWSLAATPGAIAAPSAAGASPGATTPSVAATPGASATPGAAAASPPRASADKTHWQLCVADHDYAFDLQLTTDQAPVLNGEAGLSRKSSEPGAASYYYSMPRLSVRGRVVRAGQPLEVKGLAWLDREWGSGSLGRTQEGWDWFALQLDDGSVLMFYALRAHDGARDPHSAGTWVAPDGTPRPLANSDVQIEVKDFWNSPRGGRYPARWQLRVPALALDVDIKPRLAEQELPTNPRYWEGAATIAGSRANQPVTGRAYVELVGYATAADEGRNVISSAR